jgi:trans-2,3-dihydro-3-hydroxyanthranilate isomerase
VIARRYTIVDVFTERPLTGNPLAVFGGEGLEGELMQRTARELSLSETTFVLPARGDADAHVRIFTPSTELPFAGHPVLGTAVVLGRRSATGEVRLELAAGLINVRLERRDGGVTFGEMEQPIPREEPAPDESALLAALGVEGSELPIQAYRNGPVHVYVALPSADAVASLRPDLRRLAELGPQLGFNCFSRDGLGFKTRMFGPALGVAEDPATGSAAGPLAAHLARHGWIRYGAPIEIRQGAESGRPSILHARVEGRDGHLERVLVAGSAVIVAEGEYRLE